MDLSKIHNYIIGQLNAGLSSQDIITQLRQAGWGDVSIQSGFSSVAASLNSAPAQPVAPIQDRTEQTVTQPATQPTTVAVAAEPVQSSIVDQPSAVQTLPPPLKRSRIKIGWLLLKQSLGIIKSSPGLFSYVIVSLAIVIGLEAVFVGLLLADYTWWHVTTGDSAQANLAYYGGIYIFMVATTFVTYFFTVALSTHVLSVFRGKPSTFSENIAATRRKIPAILTYTLISVTVGFILRFIEERLRILGYIISMILGALWSLLTTFTLPVIADSDESGGAAVKTSFQLFKANWGQTIASRVGLGGLASIFYVMIIIPVSIGLLFLVAPLGLVGMYILLGVIILTLVAFAMVVSLATSVLNVSLYYYARYNAIPPSFDAELLASAFIEKKKKGNK